MLQAGLGTLKRISGRLRRLLSYDVPTRIEPELPRILVIDDEESICFSMREYFSHLGYRVDTVRELADARRLINELGYTVVIQDLRLGVKSDAEGLELVKFLHDSHPATRVIVLTAYGSRETEDEAKLCGADAFLWKPKPLSQVAQVVQGLLESPSRSAMRSPKAL